MFTNQIDVRQNDMGYYKHLLWIIFKFNANYKFVSVKGETTMFRANLMI